jgi:Flp pilus assembly protein TadD
MSNSFPKVSPDGRWIVWAQCRNGQLMRPDSRLWIVPAEGGEARPLASNLPLMNSWHSFSPNGRWLVFSSKTGSPYTRMFLTHIEGNGEASPAILVGNATAANRAVNIPEFVNVAAGGLETIEAPAAEFYSLFDSALELENKSRHAEAVAEWKRALAIDAENPKAHTNLGIALWGAGARREGLAEFRKAVELRPGYAEARNNLGVALVESGRPEEAIAQFRAVLELRPDSGETRNNLAVALLRAGRAREALPEFRKVLEANPRNPAVLAQMAWILATSPYAALRNGAEAVDLARRAAELAGPEDAGAMDTLAAAYAEAGRFNEAVAAAARALDLARAQKDEEFARAVEARLTLYRTARPFREP